MRSRRERTDGADGDRARSPPPRATAPGRAPTSATIGDEAEHVGATSRRSTPAMPAPMPRKPTRPTRSARRRGSSKKRGTGRLVRACGLAALDLGDDLGRCRRAATTCSLSSGSDGEARRAVVGLREQQLVGRVEDAVASLELRAIDGEVGLVDELVRVLAVAREARRRPSRWSRGSARSTSRPRTGARRPRGGCGRRSRTPARAASPAGGSRTPRRRSGPARRSGAAAARKISAMPRRTASPARWP